MESRGTLAMAALPRRTANYRFGGRYQTVAGYICPFSSRGLQEHKATGSL